MAVENPDDIEGVLNKAKEEFMSWKHKGWDGLGAFDPNERKIAYNSSQKTITKGDYFSIYFPSRI